MYSTDLRDQFFSAALPLKPLVAWCGSACSVTVAVPPAPAIAGLQISTVAVSLTLPDGSVVSADAVAISGTPLWTATFPAGAFSTSGKVAEGFTVALGGKDERGEARVWIVAKGDLEVKSGDATPTPGESYYLVKLRDSAPANPVKGDAYVSDGELHIFAGGEWVVIGGGHDAAKLDGAATYPAWESDRDYAEGDVAFHNGKLWRSTEENQNSEPSDESASWYRDGVTIGFLKQDKLSSAQMDAVNSGATAEKVATWDGYAAQIASKADATDLPYAMVTPGKWEFSGSGVQSGMVYHVEITSNGSGGYYYTLYIESLYLGQVTSPTDTLLIVHFDEVDITATRASLPGHLLDRAGNRVVVSGDTTLTLPALVNAGKARDFIVRLEISGSTVPTITFAAPTGETITYETDGDEFPAPDEAGTWLYSFTETAAHKFAVALKKVNTVAQGGS